MEKLRSCGRAYGVRRRISLETWWTGPTDKLKAFDAPLPKHLCIVITETMIDCRNHRNYTEIGVELR